MTATPEPNIFDSIRRMNEVEQLIESQRQGVMRMLAGIRPLAIVDPQRALLELLQLFESDGGARASSVAAFLALELIKLEIKTGEMAR